MAQAVNKPAEVRDPYLDSPNLSVEASETPGLMAAMLRGEVQRLVEQQDGQNDQQLDKAS